MPIMDGPTLYRTLERDMPRYVSRTLFVTGDTLSISVREFLHSYAFEVIEKPYTPEDVRRALVIHQRITRGKAGGKKEEGAHAPL